MSKLFDIKSERDSLGLSQTQLADLLGVNQSTVARWERRPERMKPYIISAIKLLKSGSSQEVA